MNPLHPSPRLLRKIAAHIGQSSDRQIATWLEAMRALPKPRKHGLFHQTSVVPTYRDQRLCGFEVWRHLERSCNDPSRKKARLWFGRLRHGGQRRCLQVAYRAAAIISKMSRRELREWWSEYRAARAAHRQPSNLWRDEQRFTDGLDYADRRQLSHVFSCAD